MGVLERIAEIEREIAQTQKNKATEGHLGRLKAQLAKLRAQVLEDGAKKGKKGEGFEVQKGNFPRVSLVGLPSSGKSTCFNHLCGNRSAVSEVEFTTLTAVPGLFEVEGATVQLLDLPGIIEGAAGNRGEKSRGRGRQVIATARTSDLILLFLDATKDDVQREVLERELDSMGIRLNKRKPDVSVTVTKQQTGVKLSCSGPFETPPVEAVRSVLSAMGMHNANVVARESFTVDDLIDIVSQKAVYLPCLYVYNKIDILPLSELEVLAKRDPMHTVFTSFTQGWGIEDVKREIWHHLNLVRVYTRKPGEQMPDFTDPIILSPYKGNTSVEDALLTISKDLLKNCRAIFVYGKSVKFQPQQVSASHLLTDEDVLYVLRKVK